MKKKLTLILAFCINISYFCFAQPGGGHKRAEALQIEFLTKELNLSPEESQKFWPIYNNYINEIKSVRKDNSSDQIAQEEKVLNVRKKYKDDFKRVLGSDDRVNKLFVSERNFREILRKELIKRRMNREGLGDD